jgi:ABC-type glycerol-3-phosphate transport system substrate-binding protein
MVFERRAGGKRKNGRISDSRKERRTIMKKVIVSLLVVALVIGCFAGCGKKEKGDLQQQAVSRDYVYKQEVISYNGSGTAPSGLIQIGDKVYGYSYEWREMDGAVTPRADIEGGGNTEKEAEAEDVDTATEETVAEPEPGTEEAAEDIAESYSSMIFYEILEDGTFGEGHELQGAPDQSINSFAADSQGNLYCLRNVYVYDDGSDTSEDLYYLEQKTLDDETVFSVNLNELPEIKKIVEQQGWLYINGLFAEEDALYLVCGSSILKFDKNGNMVGNVIRQDAGNVLDGASVVRGRDGKYAAINYGDNGMKVYPLDLANGTIGTAAELAGNSYSFSFYPGSGYDFYVSDNYAVYGYNLGDTTVTKLMSYVDSDIDVWQINNIIPISDTEFYGSYSSASDWQDGVSKFTKVDPKDVKERQVITLAMASTDWTVKSRVIEFNKKNDTYRISLIDYSSESGEYEEGISRMNTDIVSGKVPDIILLDDSMPTDSYISKGLFADLLPIIEKDEEIDRNDLMPNVMEAFSRDGKLYRLIPSYSIRTIVAKTSDVGEERGWTVEEAMALWDSKPEGTEFIAGATRSEMLNMCMSFAGSQFVNYSTGDCDFNNEGFLNLLEFLKRFPVEISDDYYTDEYWSSYDSLWRTGKVITQQMYLGDFRNLNYTQKGTFGEPITMIGFPSTDQDGSVLVPTMQFAISAKSKNQDAAWQFLRYYLTEDYQNEAPGFPLSMKVLEKRAEEAMDRPYYIDVNGNKDYYDDIIYIDDVEVTIDPMTREEVDHFMEILKTFKNVGRYDDTLINIISEEAEPYFNGQKNAGEVAQIIQNRAQIYLHEIQ